MHIVSMTRFIIGIVFLVIAIGLAPRALRERRFGKYRQLATLSLIGAAIFFARGLGLVDF
jgi:hypothetical protein